MKLENVSLILGTGRERRRKRKEALFIIVYLQERERERKEKEQEHKKRRSVHRCLQMMASTPPRGERSRNRSAPQGKVTRRAHTGVWFFFFFCRDS